MHPSTRKAKVAAVIPLAPRELPFETWRPIFQLVFASKSSISHPPSDFEFSPLHSRLNIYRCLAQVSRTWHDNARDVFLEDIQALTADSLKGLIKTFQNDRALALAVSRISFSFAEFRCAASMPRKPRPLRRATELEEDTSEAAPASSPTRRVPDWKTIHRRDAANYRPSATAQGSHWMRWQADVGQVLTMCTSLSKVKIVFTGDLYEPRSSQYPDYLSWFPSPDLTNESILDGLLRSINLRSLCLVNPTPLEQYGPALASWDRLKHLTIVLTRSLDELQNTVFIPPESLISLRFHDVSFKRIPWPLASDLARCTNLQVLDLGVTSLAGEETTAQAIAFLCSTYQRSLRELTLHMIQAHEGSGSFQDLLLSISPLHFPNLKRFRLPEASYDTSVFSYFDADALEYVEVGWLMLEPGTGSREDKWNRGLSHTSLRALKRLVINLDDPDPLRKQALDAVCQRLGIMLTMGHASNAPGLIQESQAEDIDSSIISL